MPSLKGEVGVERNAYYSEVTSTERVPLGATWGGSGGQWGTAAPPSTSQQPTPHTCLSEAGSLRAPATKQGWLWRSAEAHTSPFPSRQKPVHLDSWSAVQSFYLPQGGGWVLQDTASQPQPARE